MNVLRAVFGAIVWLAAVAAGAWVFWTALGRAPQCDLVGCMRDLQAPAMAAGAAVVAIALLWPLTFVLRTCRERHLSFRNPAGEVRVSLTAIRDFLARLAAEFPAIVTLRPAVEARVGKLAIDMDIKVRAGTALPELSRQIQDRAAASVQSFLGIAEVGEIRVTVREIVGPVPPAEPVVRAPRASEGPAGFVDTAAGEEHSGT